MSNGIGQDTVPCCPRCGGPVDNAIHNCRQCGELFYLPIVSPTGSQTDSTDLEQFKDGAVRQKLDDVRFDLISPIALRRLAQTYAEGAKKYSDHNWRKGMPFSSILNHILNHIVKHLLGDRSEDHLAHAAWGFFAWMEFEETKPDLNDLYDFGLKEGL